MLETHFPINRFGSLDTYINNYQAAYAGGIKIPWELHIVYFAAKFKNGYWLLAASFVTDAWKRNSLLQFITGSPPKQERKEWREQKESKPNRNTANPLPPSIKKTFIAKETRRWRGSTVMGVDISSPPWIYMISWFQAFLTNPVLVFFSKTQYL